MDVGKFRFGFIGFGHIAEAIYSFVHMARLIPPSQVLFIRRDKDKQKDISKKYGISATSLPHLVESSDVILFCVRPQQIKAVLDEFPKDVDLSSKFFITILAGTKISYFQKRLGNDLEFLRAMPNLPSSIGEGMNVLAWGKGVSDTNRHLAKSIFACMGQMEEVEEEHMDLVTALCSSSPAFIALFIDALAKLGQKEGISYEKALKMVAQTFVGTAKLVQKGALPEDLIEKIAVPGGTTEKGIQQLEKDLVHSNILKAAAAVLHRAREISQD